MYSTLVLSGSLHSSESYGVDCSGLVPMNYYPMIRRTSCATKDSVSKLHQILILNENYTIRLLVIFGTERINVESIQKTDCENLIEYSISWICLLLLVLPFP